MDRQSILIVGAGFGQLPAIEGAKAKGIRVVTADRNPNAVGMALADVACHTDILNVEGIVNIAKKYSVNGAMTMQSDIGMPAVGAVIDALKLPGCGLEVANRCSNKILTREALDKAGVEQPKFRIANSLELAYAAATNLGYPCVIKAPDSSGSRGVTKVNSEVEVSDAFDIARSYSRSEYILIEEFIAGVEIGAQAFSRNGKCQLVFVHDDMMSAPPYMIPVGHSFPSTLSSSVIRRAEAQVARCVEALGIGEGPSNIDLIIDCDGLPRIIEVGARIGATCLPELIAFHTGMDWVSMTIDSCLGRPAALESWSQSRPVAAYIVESPKDGRFCSSRVPEELSRSANIIEWEVTAKKGDIVSKLRKGTDRIGKVIATGETVEAAERLARKFRDSFTFTIESVDEA